MKLYHFVLREQEKEPFGHEVAAVIRADSEQQAHELLDSKFAFDQWEIHELSPDGTAEVILAAEYN
jgi:hypothetical protein